MQSMALRRAACTANALGLIVGAGANLSPVSVLKRIWYETHHSFIDMRMVS
jgi:hypothetical protein